MIEPDGTTWRIGTVSFLNARPLDIHLADRPDVRLVRDAPSRLAERMEREELDAALLPAIDYFRLTADARERHRHRPLVVVPGIAIASRGPVGSVRLFCRRDPAVVRHVALDPNSHTSNCLVRLIFDQVYALRPHFRWPVPDAGKLDRESDAMLLIGDRALTHDPSDYYQTLDLGDLWRRHARRPFVYAVWAAREDDRLDRLAAILAEAKSRGLAARDRLARDGADRVGISPERAREYLFENIHYDLGPEELAGLRMFYEWAAKEELAPLHIPIRLAAPARSAADDKDPE